MGDGEPHVNPLISCAIFRTSSKEDPAKTKIVCSYGGRTLETFNVTLMISEMWAGSSTAGTNMTMPGRREEAAVMRIGMRVPLSSYGHLAQVPMAFPQNSSVKGMSGDPLGEREDEKPGSHASLLSPQPPCPPAAPA